MEIRKKLRENLEFMKVGLGRFPLSLLSSILFFIVFVIKSELGDSVAIAIELETLAKTLFLSTLMFIALGLLGETDRFRLNRRNVDIFGIILAAAFYFFIKNKPSYFQEAYFIGFVLFFIVGFFYFGRDRYLDTEIYALEIIRSFLLSFLYSAVLYLGLFLVIYSSVNLFNLEVEGKIYIYLFVFIVTTFSNLLFISRLPDVDADYRDEKVSKVLSSLFTKIIIPLIALYTIILYLYFIKIIIIREMPKGVITRLVLLHGLFTSISLFFIDGIEGQILGFFKRYMGLISLPIFLMMFFSIYLRIDQYGLTLNRYFVLLMGIYFVLNYLYLLTSREKNNFFMVFFLSVFILIWTIGPLSGVKMVIKNQNKRYEDILTSQGLLVKGEIQQKSDLTREVKGELSGIVEYMDRHFSLNELEATRGMESVYDMEEYLGFPYIPYYERLEENGQSYYSYDRDYSKFEDIEDYSYYLKLEDRYGGNRHNEDAYRIKDLSLKLEEDFNIALEDSDRELKLNLKDYLDKDLNPDKLDSLGEKELIYEIEEDFKIKIIINRLSVILKDNKIEYDDISFDIFIR